MGRISPIKTSLARALFSQVQLRVLGLLLGQPERSFQVSEVIRLARVGSGAVQRELEKLTDAGIVSIVPFGTRKLYQANRLSPIFDELHGMIIKTVGLVEPLRQALKPYGAKIDVAFVYGSVAKSTDTAKSDIDLMIIGHDLDYGSIFTALHKTERILGRPINPNLMTKTEWKRKLADKSSFIMKILEQPKLFVFGTEDELKGMDNLVRAGSLKAEPGDQKEFDGLLASARKRLADANVKGLSEEGQFSLAYDAAHAFSLAAMRWHGYRPDRTRFVVFQALPHTLGLPPAIWRILDRCHRLRNLAEYEGHFEVDKQLLAELLAATETVRAAVAKLGPVPTSKPKDK